VPRKRHVVLGEVIGAHGTRGELRIAVLGDGPENLTRAPVLWLLDRKRGADDESPRALEVTSARPARAGEVRLALRGVESRDAAEALVGWLVGAEEDHLAPLPSGEFYWYQLVGCTVVSSDGHALGTVRALWDTGAHDVLVVEDEEGAEVLLPVAADLLREVDVERGRIVIEVPEGLLDPR
jgi:16S rRNA processing protein RimM